jgi:hypothetical protein
MLRRPLVFAVGAVAVAVGVPARAFQSRAGSSVSYTIVLFLVQRRGRDEVRQAFRVFRVLGIRGGRAFGEFAARDGVDALVARFLQIASVVGEQHDAHSRHGSLVELAHDAYRAVVAVVGRLSRVSLDVRVSVVLVREHEEALRWVLAQNTQPLVARAAARSALLEYHAGHDHVRDAFVREEVHLMQRHVGVHHDVRRRVLREFPARGVGAAELRRRELAADVDVVAKVVLANNLHHAASLGLLHERTVVGRRHGARLGVRLALALARESERSNLRPRASAAREMGRGGGIESLCALFARAADVRRRLIAPAENGRSEAWRLREHRTMVCAISLQIIPENAKNRA